MITATHRKAMKHAIATSHDSDNDDDEHSSKEEEEEAEPQTSLILTPVISCILVTETAERFAFFGFRAVLVLYFKEELQYDENQAIALYAYTTCLAFLSPLAGALLADGVLGRYRTILYFGIVYVIGLVILTAGAWGDWHLEGQRIITFTGLFFTCTGTGGVKPCVSAFGADQVGRSRDHHQTVAATKQEGLAAAAASGTFTVDDDMKGVSSPPNPQTAVHPPQPAQDSLYRTSDPLYPSGTTVVDLQHDRSHQVRGFFNMFYFCINVGGVTSMAIIPIVRHRFGYHMAFFIATVFMVTAVVLFVSKRTEYVHHVPGRDGSSLSTTFYLTFWLIRNHLWSIPAVARVFPFVCPGPLLSLSHRHDRETTRRHGHELLPTTEEEERPQGNGHSKEYISCSMAASKETNDFEEDDTILHQQLDDAAKALHVLPIMAMFPLFWSLYDQQGSVWTLQAERMALGGFQPEQLTAINPLEIVIFIPLFDRVLYPAMEARGWNIAPLRRMAWGMGLTAAAFFISGLVESSIQYREEMDVNNKISVFWQLPQITILTVGEIFLSVTGLEFAYSTSPDRLKAFLVAMFLLTTAVGNFISGVLYSTVFAHLNRATIMHICAILMLGNLGIFTRVSRWYERNNFQCLRRTPSMVDGVEFRARQEVR